MKQLNRNKYNDPSFVRIDCPSFIVASCLFFIRAAEQVTEFCVVPVQTLLQPYFLKSQARKVILWPRLRWVKS